METKYKKVGIIVGALFIACLLVIAVNNFLSGFEVEAEKDAMAGDFYETDKALKTKDDCENEKDDEACLKTGIYYLDGKIVEVNREKAAKYLLKACNLKNSVGCYQLGKFWQNPDENVGRMNKKSKMYFKKACDFGDLESCDILKKEKKN